MVYKVSEQLISRNRPRQALSPKGFVIHATATPGATAQNEHDYFNSGDRGASAHYFVDWIQIIQCIPENEVAWHAGATANHRYLSVEMCEPASHDSGKFTEVWNRTVWLVADACVRYGWGKEQIFSHADISNMFHETNHTDPIQYLASYGKSFNDLITAIMAEVARQNGGNAPQRGAGSNDSSSFNRPILTVGSKGHYVVELQNLLIKWGFSPGAVDGEFGPKTMAAVLEFQGKNQLTQDGIVGPLTWNKLLQDPEAPGNLDKLYRVRKNWTDVKSQLGAFLNLDSAKALADQNPGYKVFDSQGNLVYTPVVKPPQSPPPNTEPQGPPQGTPILGKSKATVNQLNQFIRAKNPQAPLLAKTYFEMEQIYGVRGDIAFAQMCKETRYLKFGGNVQPSQHNPAGLGATGPGVRGASFDTWEQGIEAQFQHLFAYASKEPLPAARPLLDSRFSYVVRGCAPYVEWLGQQENPQGRGWSADKGYGYSIINDYLTPALKNPDSPVSDSEPGTGGQPSANWLVEILRALIDFFQRLLNR